MKLLNMGLKIIVFIQGSNSDLMPRSSRMTVWGKLGQLQEFLKRRGFRNFQILRGVTPPPPPDPPPGKLCHIQWMECWHLNWEKFGGK